MNKKVEWWFSVPAFVVQILYSFFQTGVNSFKSCDIKGFQHRYKKTDKWISPSTAMANFKNITHMERPDIYKKKLPTARECTFKCLYL